MRGAGVDASPAVHRGGTLKLVAQRPVNIDPHDGDIPSASVLASMYDGLVTFRLAAGPVADGSCCRIWPCRFLRHPTRV